MSRRPTAADAERVRALHELHDLATHAVGQVIVHAGVLQTRPEDAREERAAAIVAIQRAAGSAMQDLRRIDALLDAGRSLPYAPQPDLAALADLLDDLRRSGVAREASLDTAVAVAVGPSAALAAYRVLQRLLDAVRSLDGARLDRVAVSAAGPRVLVVEADADVPPEHEPETVTSAFGAAGERARLHGGTLDLDRPEPRRWRARTSLPLAG